MPHGPASTRNRIFDAAERLVIENGFAGTAVERVITESQSSKGAFFHHFPTKNDLAKALVHRYVAADLAHLDDAVKHVRTCHPDPVHRVLAFIDVFERSVHELVSAQSSCL